MCVKNPFSSGGALMPHRFSGYHGDESRKGAEMPPLRCFLFTKCCLWRVGSSQLTVSLPSASRRRHVPRHLPRVFPHGVSQPGEAETTERALPPLLQVVRPEEAGQEADHVVPPKKRRLRANESEGKSLSRGRSSITLLFWNEDLLAFSSSVLEQNKSMFFCTFVR